MKHFAVDNRSLFIKETESGCIYVSHDVIQSIIYQVALDTPGVAEKDVNFITKLLSRKTGKAAIQDYAYKVLELQVVIKVYYGVNIPSVCHEVQKLIAFKLKEMLGIEKAVVNIRVDGIIVQKEDTEN